jgi:ribosomal-protein-alanine N-acetyltransferase
MANTAKRTNTIQAASQLATITIHPFLLEHLDAVMSIEPLTFGPNHWSRQIFINELNNEAGVYFVAVDSKSTQVFGYSGFWLIGEEAHITTLAVHPDYQKQYIGERLLVNNILQARKFGAHWLTLEVRASNEPAQKLYSKYGFKSLGVLRRYYQDNLENALILWSDNIESVQFNELLDERMSSLKNRTGE